MNFYLLHKCQWIEILYRVSYRLNPKNSVDERIYSIYFLMKIGNNNTGFKN